MKAIARVARVGLQILLACVAGAVALGALPALAQAPSTTLPKLTLPGLSAPPAGASVPPGAAVGSGQPAAQAPWIKACSTDPTKNKNVCAVRVEVPDSTGQQLLVSATVQTIQDDPKMLLIVTVPPGMLLQPGVQVAIDTNKPMPLLYMICQPNACFAQSDFTADNLKAIRAGKQLTIAAIDQSGQQVSLPLSLAGFAKAYDGPAIDPNAASAQAGPAIDPNAPSGPATPDALAQSLEQHADQARQVLTNQLQAPSGK